MVATIMRSMVIMICRQSKHRLSRHAAINRITAFQHCSPLEFHQCRNHHQPIINRIIACVFHSAGITSPPTLQYRCGQWQRLQSNFSKCTALLPMHDFYHTTMKMLSVLSSYAISRIREVKKITAALTEVARSDAFFS